MTDDAEVVEIKVRENGPYKVTGPVRLIDADGNEFVIPDKGRPIALCRCGHSHTKPFCDKSHREIGFDACERAVAEREA
jgi:CDGSH-type Zn-finger protein